MTQEQEKWLALQQEIGEHWFKYDGQIWKGNRHEYERWYVEENEDNDLSFADWLENNAEEIEVEDYDENGDYLVYTDDEADEAWGKELDNYIEECILPEIPERYRFYFDDEKWKRDAKYDGRGHSLARYDGNERTQDVNGTTYYIYRVN